MTWRLTLRCVAAALAAWTATFAPAHDISTECGQDNSIPYPVVENTAEESIKVTRAPDKVTFKLPRPKILHCAANRRADQHKWYYVYRMRQTTGMFPTDTCCDGNDCAHRCYRYTCSSGLKIITRVHRFIDNDWVPTSCPLDDNGKDVSAGERIIELPKCGGGVSGLDCVDENEVVVVDFLPLLCTRDDVCDLRGIDGADPTRQHTRRHSVEIEAKLATEPSPPRNVVVEPGDRSATLSWDEPEDPGGLPIEQYTYVVRAPHCGQAKICASGPVMTRSITIEDLTNGEEHQFDVRAWTNSNLWQSVYATVMGTPGTTPGPPEVVVLTVGDQEVTLAVGHPRPEDTRNPGNGGWPILKYEYRFAASGGQFSAWTPLCVRDEAGCPDDPGDADISQTFVDLRNGVSYTFEVRAENTLGTGEIARVQGVPVTRPSAPVLTVKSGDGSATLSWTLPDDGGSVITGYDYCSYTPPNSCVWLDTGSGLKRALVVEPLTNGTAYHFQVRAKSAQRDGAASTAAIQTPAATPGGEDLVLSVEEEGDGEVTLSWEPPPASPAREVRRYEYRVAVQGAWGPWIRANVVLGSPELVVSNLVNGVEYSFEVRALSDIGAGKPSNAVAATPQADTATVDRPSAPTLLDPVAGDGRVDLSWRPAVARASPVERYEYRYAATGEPFPRAWTPVGNVLEVTVSALTNGVSYTFEVRAVDEDGRDGDASSRKNATPVAAPARRPDAPAGFAADAGDGEVKLRWDALGPTSGGGATDGGAAIERYEYRYAVTGEDFPLAWVRVGYALEATVPGLDNGVQYTFQVRAVNRLGEGAHAEAVSSPRAGLPDAPRAVTARAGDGSVTLGWSTPGRVGASAVVSYEYRWNAGRGFGAPASVEPTGAAQTVLVAGLANGVRHTFEVRAVNEVGAGPWAPRRRDSGGAGGRPQRADRNGGGWRSRPAVACAGGRRRLERAALRIPLACRRGGVRRLAHRRHARVRDGAGTHQRGRARF